MEILLGKVVVFGLTILAMKLYWEKRAVEHDLYISKHIFLDEDPIEGAKIPNVNAKQFWADSKVKQKLTRKKKVA